MAGRHRIRSHLLGDAVLQCCSHARLLVAMPNSPNSNHSNPSSPLQTMNAVGSPIQSGIVQNSGTNLLPANAAYPAQLGTAARSSQPNSRAKINYIQHLSCRIILAGLGSNLKPATHAVMFQRMVNWLVNWDQGLHGVNEVDRMQTLRLNGPLHEWMHLCLDVIWILLDEDKCLVPFYELTRSKLQFLERIPDDEAFFSIIIEIHRRREMVCKYMAPLDQHLHSPTFAIHQFLSESYQSMSGQSVADLLYSPITYPSVFGEPLRGS